MLFKICILHNECLCKAIRLGGEMSSTVTTTTTAALSSVALAASLSLILVVTLLMLLIHKDIISTSTFPWAERLNRALNIAIVPLLVIFSLTLIVRLFEVLA